VACNFLSYESLLQERAASISETVGAIRAHAGYHANMQALKYLRWLS
jgi:hypothetical protein